MSHAMPVCTPSYDSFIHLYIYTFIRATQHIHMSDITFSYIYTCDTTLFTAHGTHMDASCHTYKCMKK